MVMENAVSGAAPQFPISVHLGLDLVIEAGRQPSFENPLSKSQISSSSYGSQNNRQMDIFIHDPKHDGMLIV